jgi:hypothetical protein
MWQEIRSRRVIVSHYCMCQYSLNVITQPEIVRQISNSQSKLHEWWIGILDSYFDKQIYLTFEDFTKQNIENNILKNHIYYEWSIFHI